MFHSNIYCEILFFLVKIITTIEEERVNFRICIT